MSTFSRIVRNNWLNLYINSFKSFSYSEPFVCPIPKNIRRLSILRRVPDETLPDLPLPAPKRLKRAAPEPEEPPVVQKVPKAELTGKIREDGDEITDKREEIKQWTEMTTKCRHSPIPLIWYFTISTPNPLILAFFSIGSFPFAVSCGDSVIYCRWKGLLAFRYLQRLYAIKTRWLQSSNWIVWLHACLGSMKICCHVHQCQPLDKINEAAQSPKKRWIANKVVTLPHLFAAHNGGQHSSTMWCSHVLTWLI